MKILFLKIVVTTLFVGIGILFIQAAAPSSNQYQIQTESGYACKYDQCHATAKSTGKRCKHCVSNKGDLYCWQH
jgi:cell division protein FtsL